MVNIYDEKGLFICSKSAGARPGEGLKGYTGGIVSIQSGHSINTYNEAQGKIYEAYVRRRCVIDPNFIP